jgi:hypothetical protein
VVGKLETNKKQLSEVETSCKEGFILQEICMRSHTVEKVL